ncbi:tRNA(adenine34) deaminase [Podochytrium sp. JEL0797]|nr:tRNA(adenine34) deaminase [Podochytrium sp. JEL0797]
MTAALGLAEEAFQVGEVPVGCVIVLDGKRIIGSGRNKTNESLNGTRHAEFEAIDMIMANLDSLCAEIGEPVANAFKLFAKCDLYVTVEPCLMCASALRHVQIRKVYFGLSICAIDNKPEPAYEIESGIFKEEAIMMLRRFYLRENERGED